jgi:hypothetical protein
MAQLFLANCTKQHLDFWYRVPAEGMGAWSQPRMLRIEAGTQMRVYQEAPLAVLEAIVDQHRHFGLVRDTEITNTKDYVGLCYAFDRPVQLSLIEYAFDHNNGVLFDRGERQREAAALQLSTEMETIRGRPTEVEVEVSEDGENPKFARAVRITRDEHVRDAGGRLDGSGWRAR